MDFLRQARKRVSGSRSSQQKVPETKNTIVVLQKTLQFSRATSRAGNGKTLAQVIGTCISG
jgi:hypothetical protein